MGCLDLFPLVVMALKAKFRRFLEQLKFVHCTMGTVASGASHHLDGIVDMLLLIDRFFHVHMAHQAEGIAVLNQLFWIGRLMRIVAAGTFPFGHRRMNVLQFAHRYIMAVETEFA
jgi:hypothetical protein